MGTTYESSLDLQLGQVPNVEDEALYQEFLDIHNAIEQIATQSSSAGDFGDKFRSVVTATEDYAVQITDGLIRVNAAAGDVIIALHTVSGYTGYQYSIKRIDLETANKVTIIGDGSELIDEHEDGINLSTKSSYTVKAHDTGWNII